LNASELSLSSIAGGPNFAIAACTHDQAASADSLAATTDRNTLREWSSIARSIFTAVSSASIQSIPSSCQQPFGADASNRRHDLRGRFCGWATTRPRRTKTRWMVRTLGGSPPARSVHAHTDWAPPSSPCPTSSSRLATSASSTAEATWFG
jgi:hypothetical protein